jgi:hypothetical protein
MCPRRAPRAAPLHARRRRASRRPFARSCSPPIPKSAVAPPLRTPWPKLYPHEPAPSVPRGPPTRPPAAPRAARPRCARPSAACGRRAPPGIQRNPRPLPRLYHQRLDAPPRARARIRSLPPAPPSRARARAPPPQRSLAGRGAPALPAAAMQRHAAASARRLESLPHAPTRLRPAAPAHAGRPPRPRRPVIPFLGRVGFTQQVFVAVQGGRRSSLLALCRAAARAARTQPRGAGGEGRAGQFSRPAAAAGAPAGSLRARAGATQESGGGQTIFGGESAGGARASGGAKRGVAFARRADCSGGALAENPGGKSRLGRSHAEGRAGARACTKARAQRARWAPAPPPGGPRGGGAALPIGRGPRGRGGAGGRARTARGVSHRGGGARRTGAGTARVGAAGRLGGGGRMPPRPRGRRGSEGSARDARCALAPAWGGGAGHGGQEGGATRGMGVRGAGGRSARGQEGGRGCAGAAPTPRLRAARPPRLRRPGGTGPRPAPTGPRRCARGLRPGGCGAAAWGARPAARRMRGRGRVGGGPARCRGAASRVRCSARRAKVVGGKNLGAPQGGAGLAFEWGDPGTAGGKGGPRSLRAGMGRWGQNVCRAAQRGRWLQHAPLEPGGREKVI